MYFFLSYFWVRCKMSPNIIGWLALILKNTFRKKKVLIKKSGNLPETAEAGFPRLPDNPSLTDHTVVKKRNVSGTLHYYWFNHWTFWRFLRYWESTIGKDNDATKNAGNGKIFLWHFYPVQTILWDKSIMYFI